MRAAGCRAHTASMNASDEAALRGGVSRPSRKAWTRTAAPAFAASSTIAAIWRSWLCTPPGESRPSTWTAWPVPAAARTASASTGLRANSPSAIALSIRVKSW